MPTQNDVQRLMALREAKRRGMLGPTQSAAVGVLENRFSDYFKTVAEPTMTAASAAFAEPVSGFVGLAALPFGSDVATRAIEKTQDAMTYQPRSEAGQQGLQGLMNVLGPVGEAFEGASSYLGDAAYEATGSPAAGAAAYSIPAMGLELLGLKGARAASKAGKLGKQLEVGDIGSQRFGQRGAIGGVKSSGSDIASLSYGDVYSALAKAEDTGGPSEVLRLASQIIRDRPDLKDAVYEDYVNLGYNLSDVRAGDIGSARSIKDSPGKGDKEVLKSLREADDITPEAARSLFDSDTIPDGWMVHGRYGRQDIDTGNVIQLSKDWGVAESYGKNGSMWMIRESSPETLLDLSSQNTDDMARVIEKAIKDYEDGALPWADDVYQAIGREPTTEDIELAVRSEFAPENIVDSAQAFDNESWVSWLADSFEDKAIIKTPDGGVVLDPSRVKKVKVGG